MISNFLLSQWDHVTLFFYYLILENFIHASSSTTASAGTEFPNYVFQITPLIGVFRLLFEEFSGFYIISHK